MSRFSMSRRQITRSQDVNGRIWSRHSRSIGYANAYRKSSERSEEACMRCQNNQEDTYGLVETAHLALF
jgi:hypothetical protein